MESFENKYIHMKLTNVTEKFPFLSCVKSQGKESIVIILNHDDKIISYYEFEAISTVEEKKAFLELGDQWWYESNRLLPISIFLYSRMRPFKYCIRTMPMKEVEILFGPVTSLNNLMKKRIKKRQIQLVKKI